MRTSHSFIRFTAATLGTAALATLALIAPQASTAPAVAEETTAAGCAVDTAVLEWGVKLSFRSYISGSIAQGSWEVADGAEYEVVNNDGVFRWSNGEGSVDPETGVGSVTFPGSIHFTGHGGVLDLVFANPTVEFRGDGSADLLLDARSNNAQGELVVDSAQVPTARIDGIGEIDPESGAFSFTAAPAILTADGATAFGGFYATGDALDPVTLSVGFGSCETASAVEPTTEAGGSTPTEEITATPISAPVDENEVPWVPIIVGGIALVVIVAAGGLLLAGRKKKGGDASAE